MDTQRPPRPKISETVRAYVCVCMLSACMFNLLHLRRRPLCPAKEAMIQISEFLDLRNDEHIHESIERTLRATELWLDTKHREKEKAQRGRKRMSHREGESELNPARLRLCCVRRRRLLLSTSVSIMRRLDRATGCVYSGHWNTSERNRAECNSCDADKWKSLRKDWSTMATGSEP